MLTAMDLPADHIVASLEFAWASQVKKSLLTGWPSSSHYMPLLMPGKSLADPKWPHGLSG
jgi:hypothetical protein